MKFVVMDIDDFISASGAPPPLLKEAFLFIVKFCSLDLTI